MSVVVTVLAVVVACAVRPTVAVADLKRLTDYPLARCLDGSHGGFYVQKGSAPGIVISLEGGGECVTKESCLARAKTDLGSSKNYQPTMHLGQYQDPSEYDNPLLFNYTMIFVKYCTGDLFSGTVRTPSASTYGLYFSGHLIVDALREELMRNYGLNDTVKTVVFSGDSAGGLGVFINVDNFAAHLPDDVRVVAAPIGGFYFANDDPYTGPGATSYIPWGAQGFPDYVKLWQSFVPTACAEARPAELVWQCMLANFSIATLKVDVFIVESQTDGVVMPLHDGVPKQQPFPTPVLAYVTEWGATMRSAIRAWLVPSQASRRAVFTPACWLHCNYSANRPLIDGRSFITAFNQFFTMSTDYVQVHMDSCGTMCNPTCPDSP